MTNKIKVETKKRPKKTQISLKAEVFDRLKRAAEDQEISIAELIDRILKKPGPHNTETHGI